MQRESFYKPDCPPQKNCPICLFNIICLLGRLSQKFAGRNHLLHFRSAGNVHPPSVLIKKLPGLMGIGDTGDGPASPLTFLTNSSDPFSNNRYRRKSVMRFDFIQ